MMKIRVSCYDEYIVDITKKEEQKLRDGVIDITELLEEKKENGKAVWKNGGTDWE